LPERAVVAGLPAFDRFGAGFVAGVGRKVVFEGPAADTGTVGFEVEAAEQFAGGGAVGRGRFGGEEFSKQRRDFGWPVGVVVTAGEAGRPGPRVASGGGQQILGSELVKATQANAQFGGDRRRSEVPGAGLSQEMTDEWRGNAMDQLLFFIAPKVAEGWIFRFETDSGRG